MYLKVALNTIILTPLYHNVIEFGKAHLYDSVVPFKGGHPSYRATPLMGPHF